MDILLSTRDPLTEPADFFALAVDEQSLGEDALVDALDGALGGVLRRAIRDERFTGKPGQSLVLHTHGRAAAARVGLFGVATAPVPATAGTPTPAAIAQGFAGRAQRAAAHAGAAALLLAPGPLAAKLALEPAELAYALALGARLSAYRFARYQTDDAPRPVPPRAVTFALGAAAGAPAVPTAVARARPVAAAVARARDLVNEPPSVMTPRRLAEAAAEIVEEAHGLTLTVLGPRECEAQGMGLFLAVARGSAEEPRFVHLTWKPADAKKRVVIVGKGVTFDSGGLSLKPSDAMFDMKTDMAGAAAVVSAMAAVAAENLPVEVHALAACTENMIGGKAYKLGDVLRSRAGKTVEINNTDAEGRLTLADALSYAVDLKPDAIVDLATLTGACMVALGPHIAGVMSNDAAARDAWLAAARAAGEDMWPLPLPERLREMLKSEVADTKNTGERWGGALTAGLFLKDFAGDVPWVHVDIAGPSTADKDAGPTAKGGTGFGVATIVEYLRRVAGS